MVEFINKPFIQSIDYSLQLEEFSKVQVLVKDVLSQPENKYQCDVFNETECHSCINKDHGNFSNNLKTNEFSFCQFVDLLREKYSQVNIIQSRSYGSVVEKPCLLVRYKVGDSASQLDWCDFQPWRSPYVLFAYASCKSKEDLLRAMESFDETKYQYKKTLIESKLFIQMTGTLDNELSLTMNMLNPNPYNICNLNIDDEVKKSNFIINKNLQSFTFNRNSSIFHFDLDAVAETKKNTPLGTSLEKDFDTAKLHSILKFNQSNIIYFEFSPDDAQNDSRMARIDLAVIETLSIVYHKLLNMANIINNLEEKQLNFYSERLKSPIETAQDTQSKASGSTLDTTTSFLSIKLFNRKVVSARILKHKADLYLGLNMTEMACIFYEQAYVATKKENDLYWSLSALEGLLAASYFYFRDFSGCEKSQKGFKNSLKRKFSSQKDLSKLVIPIEEFTKNYTHIISSYNKNEVARFLSLELSFVVTKLFIHLGLRNEALSFINFTVYINNLKLEEEARIRRYYEIGSVYELLGLKRLCSFYRWISASRVFNLMSNYSDDNNNHKDEREENLKRSGLSCLINQCAKIMLENYELMKLLPQLTPILLNMNEKSVMNGFPKAKKQMLLQTIDMFSFLRNYQETSKFIKYLLTEFGEQQTSKELEYFKTMLILSVPNGIYPTTQLYDAYNTKFFDLPKINSFEIQSQNMGLSKIEKIKSLTTQTSTGIYIHRYENPLLTARVKTVYNFYVDQLNIIEVSFTNLMSIELNIERFDLIIESHQDQKNFSVEMRKISELKNNFVVPPNERNFKISFGFEMKLYGKFKIIGYDLNLWNTSNRILFSDLAHDDTKTFSNVKNSLLTSSFLKPFYEIEIFPKIPITDEIDFYLEDANNNCFLADSITQVRSSTLTCKLGILQNFDVRLKLRDPDINDIDMYQVTCSSSNEYYLSQLNASISAQLCEGRCLLQVDSTSANSDSIESSCLDVSCILELKYTNKLGREENLNHTVRKQLTIKFEKVISATIEHVKELDHEYFELGVSVNNLQDESVYIDLHEITAKSMKKLNFSLKKLQVSQFLSQTDFEMIFMQRFNQNLEKRIVLSDEKINISLRFEDKALLREYKNIIIRCPVELKFNLSSQATTTAIMNSGDELCSLIMAITSKQKSEGFKKCKIFVEVKHKLKNKILNFKKFKADNLDTETLWLNEFLMILKNKDLGADKDIQNKLNIRIRLIVDQATARSFNRNLEWEFVLNLRTDIMLYSLN